MDQPVLHQHVARRLANHSTWGAACIALLFITGLASCGSSTQWSEQERSELINNCLTNARIADEQLRDRICRCWLERTEPKYTYSEVNSGSQAIQADFLEFGKACSAEHNVRATLPGEE